MARERGLPGATKAKEQKPKVSQLPVPRHPNNLAGRVQPKIPLLLGPVHHLAQHCLLILTLVVAPQDNSQTNLGKNDGLLLRPLRHRNSDKVGFASLWRKQGIAPHQRYPGIVGGNIHPTIPFEGRRLTHDPVQPYHFLITQILQDLTHQLNVPRFRLTHHHLGELGNPIPHLGNH